jgi:hypothetical protein
MVCFFRPIIQGDTTNSTVFASPSRPIHTCMYVCTCLYICVYIYIYKHNKFAERIACDSFIICYLC